jgi:hypothetical protein
MEVTVQTGSHICVIRSVPDAIVMVATDAIHRGMFSAMAPVGSVPLLPG